jgi:Uma2 family endonuclease
VRLGAHVVRPDLAGWRRERLPSPWDERRIEALPDWVCEIVSPSNAAHDRVTKRRIYGEQRVPFYWIVDPVERTLEVLRLEGSTWVDGGTFDATAVARVPPFKEVELVIGRLFPPP